MGAKDSTALTPTTTEDKILTKQNKFIGVAYG